MKITETQNISELEAVKLHLIKQREALLWEECQL